MPENYLFAVTMINNNNTDNIILTKTRKKKLAKHSIQSNVNRETEILKSVIIWPLFVAQTEEK